MTHTTGLIRITLGFLCALGALGGMDQQPGAGLLAQTGIAVVGLVLMLWAARDINRIANRTINQYKD
jgi:thiamine monophosphate synthase